MATSLHEHFRVQDTEDHGAPLFFNSRVLGGVPFRGQNPPPLREDEFDELEVRPVAHVRTFDLGEETQREQYETILHRIVNGWYTKLHDHHWFDPVRRCMVVHLEWCQLYKETPSYLARLLEEEGRG